MMNYYIQKILLLILSVHKLNLIKKSLQQLYVIRDERIAKV